MGHRIPPLIKKTEYAWLNGFDGDYTASKKIEEELLDFNTLRQHSTILFFPLREFRKTCDESEGFRTEYTKHLLKMRGKKGAKKN
ncbi:MAG: hypothetical protein QXU18_10870 [Thermoplasmatales archaeon]